MIDVSMSGEASRLAAGVPEALAERAGVWPLLHTGFDLVELAAPPSAGRRAGRGPMAAVRRARPDVAVGGHRGAAAVGPLADPGPLGGPRRPAVDAGRAHRGVRRERGIGGRWLQANSRPVARVGTMLTEIRRAESYNLTTLSVALRQLRNLALTSVDSDAV